MRILILLCFLLSNTSSFAQLPPQPLEEGAAGLALLLRKLDNYRTVLHITAHPDDEDNGLLVQLNRVDGVRTALLTLTRGAGGQNQIGDEQGIALSILRTEELASMHQIDGAEQYFARAVDFGYSFSVEETMKKWGKDEILRDIVYWIRKLKPDVVVCLAPRGEGGGQHHQASGILSREAFTAAADPNMFPDQINQGLQPWQVKKVLSRMFRVRYIPEDQKNRAVEISTGILDPLLGKTAYQLGRASRSFHICQDMNQPEQLPQRAYSRLFIEESAIPLSEASESLFSGIPSSPFALLSKEEQKEYLSLNTDLDIYSRFVQQVRESFKIAKPWDTITPLHQCLTQMRMMINKIEESALSLTAKQDVLVRLKYQEKVVQQALVFAHGVQFNALSNKGEITPGGNAKISLHAYNASPVSLKNIMMKVEIPNGYSAKINQQTNHEFDPYQEIETVYDIEVPDSAAHNSVYWDYHPTMSRYEWHEDQTYGLPFAKPAMNAVLTFTYAGNTVSVQKPIMYRYENPWGVGGKEKELSILPRISLSITPNIIVFTNQQKEEPKTVIVNVQKYQEHAVQANVSLVTPKGWSVEPQNVEVNLNEDEKNTHIEFQVSPDFSMPGTFDLNVVADIHSEKLSNNVQTIEYQHTQKRYWMQPAKAKALILPITTVAAHIGYVMGSGDQVPYTLEQLGCDVTLLDENAISNGNLSTYDVIILGVRAYLNRMDLRKHNARLLEYVHEGGTLIVQYNKYEMNHSQWGPYPLQVSHNRVTDENASIHILQKDHPIFHFPNRITKEDWQNWVQERGIYFLGNRDHRYVDLLSSEDPFSYNPGEKRGILVEAQYGKGKWIYCGLALFRQLPAGIPGAYKLAANMAALSN